MRSIKSGSAEIDMELAKGMDLSGYIARFSGSVGIHDSLKIRSIIFDDGCSKIVLIICDLVGLSSEFVKATAKMLEQHISIASDNVIISCIHTHSGPASMFLEGCGKVDDSWLEGLQGCIINCTKSAFANIKPVILSFSTGMCDIAQNRIKNEKEGLDRLPDRQVGVLAVKDASNGKIDTILVNYACHPVVLSGKNLLFSKDYPHYMIEELKNKLGSDIKVIFVNGCCGDINPVEKGSFDIAEKLGCRLAESVLIASLQWSSDQDLGDTQLSVETIKAVIPIKTDLNEGTAVQLEAAARLELDEIKAEGDVLKVKICQAKFNWINRMKENLINGTFKNNVEAEMKVVKIGRLVLVTLPFEVFHEIGLKIKEYFGPQNTMVFGYSNGDYGYMLSKEMFSRAEYEAKKAFIYYGYPGPFSEVSEDIIYKALFK